MNLKMKIHFFFWKLWSRIILPKKGEWFITEWIKDERGVMIPDCVNIPDHYKDFIRARIVDYEIDWISPNSYEFLVEIEFERFVQFCGKDKFNNDILTIKEVKELMTQINVA